MFFEKEINKTPTKMFVSQLSDKPKAKVLSKSIGIQEKSIMGMAANILLTSTPTIVDAGLEFISDAITNFAEDKVTKTVVHKNIDVTTANKIFLPNTITIIRGDFAPKLDRDGNNFGDGENQEFNQVTLNSKRELFIEIDIIKSDDKSSIYFQPNSYLYSGRDVEGNSIDEIILAFAFMPIGKNISSKESIKFQNFLHFEQLENNLEYQFKSKTGYDTSYQSPWIKPTMPTSGPYTLMVEIQEIRRGNSFAKLVQDIYKENQEQIRKESTEAIKSKIDKLTH